MIACARGSYDCGHCELSVLGWKRFVRVINHERIRRKNGTNVNGTASCHSTCDALDSILFEKFKDILGYFRSIPEYS